MSNLGWSLLIVYLTAAASFGGWQGRNLWLGWGVWCLLLPPIAVAAVEIAGAKRRKSHREIVTIHLVMAAIGVAFLGGMALTIAWVIAEGTERLSAVPAVRAIVGGGLGAAASGLAWLAARSRKAAEPRETIASENSAEPAEPGD